MPSTMTVLLVRYSSPSYSKRRQYWAAPTYGTIDTVVSAVERLRISQPT